MALLQDYWDELRLDSNKRLVLLFYFSRTPRNPPEVRGGTEGGVGGDTFLNDLSKFDGEITLICDQNTHSLKRFSPSQPNLIQDILGWLREKEMED